MSSAFVTISKCFEGVTDFRSDRGNNHDLAEMIFIALTATICGANSWVDVERFAKAKLDWFRRYTPLRNGVPSHDTFGRVFSRLDTEEFYNSVYQWAQKMAGALRGKGVAIDGKTLRGSFDRASKQQSLHLLTAYATDLRLVLCQKSVDGKTNEIPNVKELLKLIDLSGAIVTLDAMHCQVETTQAILKTDADFVITVKANQAKLRTAIEDVFIEFGEAGFRSGKVRSYRTVERSHGRDEEREYFVTAVPKTEIFKRWPGAKSIVMVYRNRDAGGVDEQETVFFISSLEPKVRKISKLIRDHWRIETSQHHVLDVTFAEDGSRIRTKSSPEIASAFRRLALNILQADCSIKDNIRGKRLRAGWDESVLDKLYKEIG